MGLISACLSVLIAQSKAPLENYGANIDVISDFECSISDLCSSKTKPFAFPFSPFASKT
jgi:hypothetical protein